MADLAFVSEEQNAEVNSARAPRHVLTIENSLQVGGENMEGKRPTSSSTVSTVSTWAPSGTSSASTADLVLLTSATDSNVQLVPKDSHTSTTGDIMCTQQQLQNFMQCRHEKAAEALDKDFRGVQGLCEQLNTSSETGLTGDEADLRRRVALFGENLIKPKELDPYWKLVFEALQDVTLIILMASAVVSIGLSFYHSGSTPVSVQQLGFAVASGESYGWIDGVAILVAVLVVVNVTAYNDWRKERQFRSLQSKIEADQKFATIRNGQTVQVATTELVVGDVCQLKYGDVLPADGVLIHSNDLKMDEASLTGETDLVKKASGVDVMLYSSTCVMEGSGRMVVTAVGPNSQAGIIMTLLNAAGEDDDKDKKQNEVARREPVVASNPVYTRGAGTDGGLDASRTANTTTASAHPGLDLDEKNDTEQKKGATQAKEVDNEVKGHSLLQTKLTRLAIVIGYGGISVSCLTVLLLCMRFSITVFALNNIAWDYAFVSVYVNYLITGIAILVIAIPEGLPLAVTISLAYSVGRMLHDNNLVRHLDACETMGNATTICSDKTGTLTTNRMTVVATYINDNFSPNRAASRTEIHESVYETLVQAISLNCAYTSDIVTTDKPGELAKQVGNKTECALLGFVLHLQDSYVRFRQAYPEKSLYKVYTFNSSRKSMSTVIHRPHDSTPFSVFTKGASEIILRKCSRMIGRNGVVQTLNDQMRADITQRVIEKMAGDGLRTIGIAYRDFAAEPNWDDEQATIGDLTCLAILGIEDPVRAEVPKAIEKCQQAGVTVRMVTGDNVQTARSIATKCGILPLPKDDADFLVLESEQFNRLIRDEDGNVTQERFDNVWPRLRVLARSTPQDKYTLVKHIIESKQSRTREVVAVTGDGTNDGPALKMADVGFAMGITGTDVAKEASDIILTDDNFTSIVQAVKWGRNVYDSISKFIQFQLTVNVVAVIVGSIGAMTISESPLQTLQMLWVNMIMDTLAALCLATEKPTDELLKRKPYGRTSPIVSKVMLKNILCTALYQLVVMFCLIFLGANLLDIDSEVVYTANGTPGVYSTDPSEHFTFVFNTFVVMTMFNELNCRRIHGERNVFSKLHKNVLFIVLWLLTMLAQALIVQFGGLVFKTSGLSLEAWIWSLFFGTTGMLWHQVIISIPVFCGKLRPTRVKHQDATSQSVMLPVANTEADILEAPAKILGRALWLRGVARLRNQMEAARAFRMQLDKFHRPTSSGSIRSKKSTISITGRASSASETRHSKDEAVIPPYNDAAVIVHVNSGLSSAQDTTSAPSYDDISVSFSRPTNSELPATITVRTDDQNNTLLQQVTSTDL